MMTLLRVLFFGLVLIAAAVLIVDDGPRAWQKVLDWVVPEPPPEEISDDVQAEEKAADLAERGKRRQIAQYDPFYRLGREQDGLALSIVSSRTLRRAVPRSPENQRSETVVVTGSRIPTPVPLPADHPIQDMLRFVDTDKVYGAAFDFLIYDAFGQSYIRIFDRAQRVSINLFGLAVSRTQRIFIVAAADKDTNNDGRLNESDLQRLFYFNFDNGMLKQVDLPENITVLEFQDVALKDAFVVRAGLDENGDGEFKPFSTRERTVPEPVRFLQVSVLDGSVTPFLPVSLMDDLQDTLDAAPNE